MIPEGLSGDFLLDAATLAVSLFNTLILLWLGLTVLLNAEKRSLGLWVAGGMLLTGSLFFFSHTALLGIGLHAGRIGLNFWWRLAWLPVVILPYAWYGVILWYASYWKPAGQDLRRRHRAWFAAATLLALLVLLLLFTANPLPTLQGLGQYELEATPSWNGIPLLALVYLVFIVLCVLLSLDALRRPGRAEREMGELARMRARPWLAVASGVECLVSLLVGWALLWIIRNAPPGMWSAEALRTIASFDLVIAGLIALAILLAGQAIVAYEVFAGRALPRRGLQAHWRRMVLLAAIFSSLGGLIIQAPLEPIYSLLLAAGVLGAVSALVTWRSFQERERAFSFLRPFVSSAQLYDQLVQDNQGNPTQTSEMAPFRALCAELLGTQRAYLVPLGPTATLVGASLAFPDEAIAEAPTQAQVKPLLGATHSLCLALPAPGLGGAAWAIPLWNERGLSGALLLADKREGGLYTQEEMEIARAAGERLLDSLATAEITRRLMSLQRQRLAESQVLDRQTRRALHDEVLPELHAAMLRLSQPGEGDEAKASAVVASLAEIHRRVSALLHGSPLPTSPDLLRLGLLPALRRLVQDELEGAFDDITWEAQDGAEERAKTLPGWKSEVIFFAAREALRNAARYAHPAEEGAAIGLAVRLAWQDGMELVIADNGAGAAASSTGGGGHGLALHSAMMAIIGGTLELETLPGAGTRVILRLPNP